ncbi:MAG: hypothetical protein SF123_03720 [Chloroflexota bacterium]|nr:hypothetical protein [Chloroflexota bacterium]
MLILLLSGCGGDAVVFAPTPAPPDLSPLPYTHPAGTFALVVPRTWSVYTINAPTLSVASFARPNESEPLLTIALINLGETLNDDAFNALLTRYQTQIRPDVESYSEVNRTAMGDGSWRIAGYRRLAGGDAYPLNTFIQTFGERLAVIDAVVPADAAQARELQRVINTLTVNADAPLEASDIATLRDAKSASLAVIHLYAWTTDDGVFYITGEIANYASTTVTSVPVRALLLRADGTALAEAVDVVMGYGIAPGSFAPFSLRFGQGQPDGSARYQVLVGGDDWQPEAGGALFPEDLLVVSDTSEIDALRRLVLRGTVENIGDSAAVAPRAVATVFDAAQNVVASAFVDVPVAQLAAGEQASFEIAIADLGIPSLNNALLDTLSYVVSVQARAGDG